MPEVFLEEYSFWQLIIYLKRNQRYFIAYRMESNLTGDIDPFLSLFCLNCFEFTGNVNLSKSINTVSLFLLIWENSSGKLLAFIIEITFKGRLFCNFLMLFYNMINILN